MERSEDGKAASGLMNAEYARHRRDNPVHVWRYRVRARAAVDAFLEHGGRPDCCKVLDLGAAEGATLIELRRLIGAGGAYDGVELSGELIAAAGPLPTGVRLVRGDVHRLPQELEEGSYDLCTILAVLEHLPDPGRCMREAWRMLEAGGIVVATAPSPAWDRVAGRLRLVADEHHEQRMTPERLLDDARNAGFVGLRLRRFMWAPIGFLPYVRMPVSPRLALRVDAVVRRLRVLDSGFVNQLVVGRKPVRA